MYFWRINELKSRLASGAFTDHEAFPYLVGSSILVALIPAFPPDTKNIWDYVLVGWSVLLAVIGTLYVYRLNGGPAGTQFLHRFFAIGWVAMLRWAAAVVPLGILLDVFLDHPEHTGWQAAIYFAASEVILYERIGHHINDVARRAAAI